MSPVAFIDANVPIYAAGWEHPYKEPCAATFILGRSTSSRRTPTSTACPG